MTKPTTPPGDSKGRAVWILEIHRIGDTWDPVRVYPTKRRALDGRISQEAWYRVRKFVPASPRRSSR